MTALETAKHYFDLSNKSDFEAIAKLFTKTTTYHSQNTGLYIGVNDIISMQRKFHSKFKKLHWKVKSVEEIKPGVILFSYDLEGVSKDGETTQSQGLEYVIVIEGKIQHIDIRNK